MADRRLNIIIYRWGHCGHFLEFLFGLDPTVYSLCGQHDREKLYSFKDIRRQYGSWLNHHLYHCRQFGYRHQQAQTFLTQSDHTCAVLADHPFEVMNCIYPTVVNTPSVHTQFYIVQCSPELHSVVSDQFRERGLNNPLLPIDSDEQEQSYQQQSYQESLLLPDLKYINLDLIVNPMTFYSEYSRVARDMAVAVLDRDRVEDYYHTWRGQRFQGLTT